jgi:peroxiredoxin
MVNMNEMIASLLVAVFLMPIQGMAEQVPSYQQSLEKQQAEKAKQPSPFSEEDLAIMKRTGEALASRLPDPGIKVGERAPDFTLLNAYGNKVSLSDNLKEGPVVLVFYRGAWCPFCNMHLHILQQSVPLFEKYGARLITITPQTPDKSVEQIEKNALPFEVLSDLDSSVMKAYHLYFELDDELVKVYRKHGLDIEAFNGAGRNVLPVPGTFVIGSDGVVTAMHADLDYTQRMEPQAIIEALQKLSK